MSHFEILEIQDLCKRNQNGQLGEYQVGCFRVGVGSFIFLSGNDPRRYLVSRIFIQPVCLYSSVLFAILFALYVNQLHDGRSKCDDDKCTCRQ